MEISGKKVVDATKPLHIKITERDTKIGATKDPAACAAARAAVRDVPNCISARVHIGRIYIEEKNRWVRYRTPSSLRSEIIAFDRGGSFSPGEYDITPISPADRFDRSKRKSGESKNSGSDARKRRRKLHVVSGVRPHGANR